MNAHVKQENILSRACAGEQDAARDGGPAGAWAQLAGGADGGAGGENRISHNRRCDTSATTDDIYANFLLVAILGVRLVHGFCPNREHAKVGQVGREPRNGGTISNILEIGELFQNFKNVRTILDLKKWQNHFKI